MWNIKGRITVNFYPVCMPNEGSQFGTRRMAGVAPKYANKIADIFKSDTDSRFGDGDIAAGQSLFGMCNTKTGAVFDRRDAVHLSE